MPQIYVTPVRDAAGEPLRVPDVEEGFRQKLPETGKWVADAAYWRRRARDGEVEIATEAPKAKTLSRRAAKTETAAEAVANATPSEE
ncbi:MAG TPA: DUF2635 domain-containing protein [Kaistiaceae bacterium]|nr:DUF2635 domain-containing protein [Kaistiaceae bacterium]